MSINISYNYYKKDTDNKTQFYYLQYKNNRMKDWKWAYNSTSLEEILEHLERRREAEKGLIQTGERYYKNHFKTLKYRLIKLDCEEININEK
jgi:hypothetical protein